jgi:hypothetical protein
VTTISEQVDEMRAARPPRPEGEAPSPFEVEQARLATGGVTEAVLLAGASIANVDLVGVTALRRRSSLPSATRPRSLSSTAARGALLLPSTSTWRSSPGAHGAARPSALSSREREKGRQ